MAKKTVSIILFLFIMSVSLFGQQNSVSETANGLINLLMNPVPQGFRQIDSTTFTNDKNITVKVINGQVVMSMFSFSTSSQDDLFTFLIDSEAYFENNNWHLHTHSRNNRRTGLRGGIYQRTVAYSLLIDPIRNTEGAYSTGIAFSIGIENLP
jgi:hypothetical protein